MFAVKQQIPMTMAAAYSSNAAVSKRVYPPSPFTFDPSKIEWSCQLRLDQAAKHIKTLEQKLGQMQRIVKQLKNGRAKTASRAASRPNLNFGTTSNLFSFYKVKPENQFAYNIGITNRNSRIRNYVQKQNKAYAALVQNKVKSNRKIGQRK